MTELDLSLHYFLTAIVLLLRQGLMFRRLTLNSQRVALNQESLLHPTANCSFFSYRWQHVLPAEKGFIDPHDCRKDQGGAASEVSVMWQLWFIVLFLERKFLLPSFLSHCVISKLPEEDPD